MSYRRGAETKTFKALSPFVIVAIKEEARADNGTQSDINQMTRAGTGFDPLRTEPHPFLRLPRSNAKPESVESDTGSCSGLPETVVQLAFVLLALASQTT